MLSFLSEVTENQEAEPEEETSKKEPWHIK